MTTLMLFLSLLLFVYIPSKEAIHMYQQNRYQQERYLYWIKQTIQRKYRNIWKYIIAFLPVLGLLTLRNYEGMTTLLALLLFIYSYLCIKIDNNKVYIKPLVYTNRVQRLLAVHYLVYCLLFYIYIQWTVNVQIICIPLIFFLPWLLLVPISFCVLPIEKQIRKYYVRDARRILSEQADLLKIGITGSYGKTSVKTILQSLLCDEYYSFMTPHSYNNLMGITISIRTLLKPLHEIFICEMGADHVHEIDELSKFIQPQMAIVTAIGPQHLQTFQTMENIVHEKMTLVENLPNHGIAFLNKDDTNIQQYPLKNKCDIVWFGIHEEADYQACNIQYTKDGTTFQILHKGHYYDMKTRLLGEHNVSNILAAVAVAHTMKIPFEKLTFIIEQLPYVEHRLQVREMPNYTLIDNAYNSNPKGAYYALQVLKQMPKRRLLVTPGFIDLGSITKEEHRTFGKQIASCCDIVILVGQQQTKDILTGLHEEQFPQQHIHVVSTIHEAFQLLNSITTKEDTVLIENDLPDAFNH